MQVEYGMHLQRPECLGRLVVEEYRPSLWCVVLSALRYAAMFGLCAVAVVANPVPFVVAFVVTLTLSMGRR